MKDELTRLCQQVRSARESASPLYIKGGDTKAFYGEMRVAPPDSPDLLDMTHYRGILNYEPSELVITARCGTLLSEIEAVLQEQQQMLAFEPPRFGPQATIGGCVASGLAGPRRVASGSVSDFVLGARLLDSSGSLLSFGGEVMKNVAGYDVSRLLAGSLGSLGPILEVSLKVMPKPALEQTQVFSLDEMQSLAQLTAWRSQPLPISGSAWLSDESGHGSLYIRFSGSEPAVLAALESVGGKTLSSEEALVFWQALRDQKHPFFQQRPLWRIAVPPTTPPLGLGKTLIEWGGGQRWVSTAMPHSLLRQNIAAHGGHATLYRRDSGASDAPFFHPLAAGLERINRRLMQKLDPAGIFNPGRLLPVIQS